MSLPIKISSIAEEGVMQVSKSRKLPILIEVDEMKDLFAALGSFFIFDVSRPVSAESAVISQDKFIAAYAEYIQGIKTKSLIDETRVQPIFSSIFTCDLDLLYAIPLQGEKFLIKAKKPVVQLQRHHFVFSDQFHSGVMGKESVTWGIQFSYPLIFLDPKTKMVAKVEKNPLFPNTEFFDRLSKWVRHHTMATPFIFEEKQMNEPMRLGKKCFPWINDHPGLVAKKLRVKNVTHTENSSSSH